MKIETKYPAGAMKHIDDIKYAIEQAKEENIEITFWGVGQSGCISELVIDDKSRIYHPDKMPTSNFIEFKNMFHPDSRNTRSLGDYNIIDEIETNGYNDHFLFTNKRHAEKFADYVRNDPAHIKDTKDHLEECARWDRFFDYYDDYIDNDYRYDDGE